jgi:hypothetical protein
MPTLDEFTRRRLGRALVSIECTIAKFESYETADAQANVRRLKRLGDDIRTVLELAHDDRCTRLSDRV